MPEPEKRASEFIQRHGFGAFIACVMLAEFLGLNPYSPLRKIAALEQAIISHEQQSHVADLAAQNQLRQVIQVLKKQAELQAITARQACLTNAKTDPQRAKCAEIQ